VQAEERVQTLVETVVRSSNGALVTPELLPAADVDRLIAALPRVGTGTADAIEIDATLGEGGMGLVRLGRQTAIGREVAVKTLRVDRTEPQFALQLLREAWVTGALEHPNIVPIYSVGVDDAQHPVIVMKRIEGEPWSRVIHDEDRDLKWHLETLMQVCRAVEYAVSRGVVHRDLKPDNVMIGAFGEVYVLDWGIAVTLGDDRDGRLLRAADVRGVSGTPGYMAPEMVQETGADLNERTDVYLLGAILHEILTKTKRHPYDDVKTSLLSSLASEPVDYPDDVPAVLGELCNRATDLDPKLRIRSARAFREALERYLERESSRRLTGLGQERYEAWTAVLDEADATQHQKFFGECRFAFQEALRTWPANRAARDGLVRSLLRMFEHELSRDHVEAATVLLDELEGQDERAVDRDTLADARARLDRRTRALEHLRNVGAQRDLSVGRRTRAFLMLVAAVAWGGLPLGLALLQRAGHDVGYTELYLVSGLKLVDTIVVVWWARESLSKTLVNRQLTAVAFFLVIAEGLARPLTWRLGRSLESSLLTDFALFGAVFAVLTITIDRRMFVAPLVYLIGAAIATTDPDYVLYALAGSHFAAFLALAAAWRPERIIDGRR
jgi:hypothetical protein